MRTNRIVVSVALVALAILGSTAPASAQLANASAATLGLSGNNTATVRGFGAISVNPAGLGMPGSGFSLSFAPIQIRSGLDPIRLGDFADFQDMVIPAATKEAWLSEIVANGGQTGSAGLDVSAIAATFGSIGFQLSTVVAMDLNLPAGIAEALLFGNGGRTGTASDLSLAGASVNGAAVTTGGLSIAIPISNPGADVAIGATVKYSVGHGVAVGRTTTGTVTANPITVDVDFPVVHTNEDEAANSGSGVGLDVGFMLKQGALSVGASVQNVLNTFEWDTSKLDYRPVEADFSTGSSSSRVDDLLPYSGAPAVLQAAVEAQTFKPTLRVGAALDVSDDFTVSGDLHSRFSDEALALEPKFHLGAGAEFRGLKVIHLRGGAAVITDGIQYSGGASLVLGPVNLSAAGAYQTGDLGENVLGQFTLSFGGR